MNKIVMVAIAAAAALPLSACASNNASDPAGSVPSPSATSASASPSASPDEPFRATLTSAGDLNGKKIAMLSFGNNPFWTPVQAGVDAAGAELKARGATVDYVVMGASLDVPTVQTAIESAVTQGYDAIGVVPLADGACPAIKAAVEQDRALATFIAEGTCSEEAGSLFFHGQDGLSAGAIAAGAMAEQIDCKGTVGVITGSFAVQIHEDRRKGFEEELKTLCPDVEILPAVENGDDAGKAQAQATDMLTANADLTGIYVTAGGPFGAATAIQQAGKNGQVKVVCYDFVPQTVQAVRDGIIAATIGQDPFGEGYNTSILLANYLADGSRPSTYFVPVTSVVMTQDNVDAVLATQQ